MFQQQKNVGKDLASKMDLSTPVASTAVQSKTVVLSPLLLLIHCLLLLQLFAAFFVLVLVL